MSYADHLAKSGVYYATVYATVNGIVSTHAVEPTKIGNRLDEVGQERNVGLVIVDDLLGTGETLVDKLSSLSSVFSETGVGTVIPLSVVVLCGTEAGEVHVRDYLKATMPNASLFICEHLEGTHFAFGDSLGFWDTEDEKMAAKTLVRDLGVRVQRRNPLGFKEQGLLLTFSRNCPNNSLPILHGSGRGDRRWSSLFPRTKI